MYCAGYFLGQKLIRLQDSEADTIEKVTVTVRKIQTVFDEQEIRLTPVIIDLETGEPIREWEEIK